MLKVLSVAAIVLPLFVLSCPAQRGLWNIKYRNQYLKNLKKCEKSERFEDCNMGTVISVVILYQKGDRRALANLTDAATYKNTVVDDTLGWFFSELLCEHPETFLDAVLARPEKERANLLYLAAVGDSKNEGCMGIALLRQSLETFSVKSANPNFAHLASDCLEAVNKYGRPNSNTGDCLVRNFRRRSEREVAGMSPRRLVDEEVQNNIHSRESMDQRAAYNLLIHKYLFRKAVAVLPILTEFINAYDPKSTARCDEERFYVALHDADELDRRVLRLRGFSDGRLVIAALKNSVKKMKDAGFDKEYKQSGVFETAFENLNNQAGINERDTSIKDTFWMLRKIKLSDAELLEFSNYLVKQDPSYPSWSDLQTVKDYSRINEANNPLQVFVLREPDRYYRAFLRFRAQR